MIRYFRGIIQKNATCLRLCNTEEVVAIKCFIMFSWRNAALFLVSILVLQTAILINVYFNAVFPASDGEFPRETLLLFNSYDTNADGVVDIWEFEAVKQRIGETYLQPVRSKYCLKYSQPQ